MAKLSELPAILTRALRTGDNIHIVGDPGIGKTRVVEQTVARLQADNPTLGFWSVYTPSLSPIDFSVPMPDPATGMLRMYHNEKLPNGYHTPDLCGIVFLGERDNADPATNKALQKYINNEDMGGLCKPKGVIVVSDSNDISHRSGAVQQSLALLSRSRMIYIDFDWESAARYFAENNKNVYVQAYLSLRKEHWNTFDQVLKTREYGVWANPRAWERLGDAMDDADAHGEVLSHDETIGDVGESVGREFIAFLHAAKNLVGYHEIVASPDTALQPDKLSDVYAIVAMLAATVKAPEFPAIKKYVKRYSDEVCVLFLRLLAQKFKTDPERMAIANTKIYGDWFAEPAIRQAVIG